MIDVAVDISLENVNFKSNIYTSDPVRSKNVKTEVTTLSIKTSERTLNVSNLTEPIVINIKNNPVLFSSKNISLFLPGDVVFNKTKLTSPDCNMIVNFDFLNDPDNLTELVVFVQYGREPSSDDFDVKLHITHEVIIFLKVLVELNEKTVFVSPLFSNYELSGRLFALEPNMFSSTNCWYLDLHGLSFYKSTDKQDRQAVQRKFTFLEFVEMTV